MIELFDCGFTEHTRPRQLPSVPPLPDHAKLTVDVCALRSFSDLHVLDTRGGLLTAANTWSQVKYGADAIVPPKRSSFQWVLDGKDSVVLVGGYCKVSACAMDTRWNLAAVHCYYDYTKDHF